MAQQTRKTRLGRVRPAPRIDPTYGTAAQRKARRQHEAIVRQVIHDDAIARHTARLRKASGRYPE